MADISDVTALLTQTTAGAVYPSGTSSPSVAGVDVRVFEGWPVATQLDADIAAGKAQVSIFTQIGYSDPGQLLDRWDIATVPVHGMAATLSADQITIALSGTPGVGEYVTAVVQNRKGYSFANPGGGTSATMAAGLAALIAVDWPSTVASGSNVLVAGTLIRSALIGAVGAIMRRLHRQKSIVRISVWAPTPASRTALTLAIDTAVKQNLRVFMPDGTQALVVYDGTMVFDNRETVSVFRRDLLYMVQYDSTVTYPAYEVTSPGVTVTINSQ
jgi:hypothetical protein